MIAAAVAVLPLTQVDGHSGSAVFLIAMGLLGFGIGLSEPPATDAIMGGFGDDKLGAASGLNDTTMPLATAVKDAAGDAFATAVQSASWVAGVVLLVGGVVAATILPDRQSWDRS